MVKTIKKTMITYSVLYGSINNSLKIGSNSLTCFVIENKVRVITTSSIQKALNYEGKSENWLPEFLKEITKFSTLYNDLISAYTNPFLIELADLNTSKKRISAVDAKCFLDACQAIIKAKNEGFLSVSQLKHSRAAKAILDNIKNRNLNDLIDEATGFNLFKKNSVKQIIRYMQNQVQDNAYEWISTLPDEFIERLMLMNESNWAESIKNQSILAKIINEIIFSRIENNISEEMRVQKPKREYKRKNNLKQNIEHPKLKEYITSIQSLIKASGNNWNIFIQLINKAYPKQKNRIVINYPEDKDILYESESNFNEKLKMVLLKN